MKHNLSNKINSFEAKTHFSQLLQRVKEGERITILKHNSPIAVLVPVPGQKKPNINEIIDEIKTFNKEKNLGDLSIKDLIIEGRK